jgi:hypothetical protein
MKEKPKKSKSTGEDKSDILYSISNTAIPVNITRGGEVQFIFTDAQSKLIESQDKEKIAEYKDAMDKSILYLQAEGFLDAEYTPFKNN